MRDKRKILNGVIVTVCIAVIILVIVFYAIFMSGHIFTESSEHLEEIYYQVGDTFNQKVSDYHNLMASWKNYITYLTERPDTSAGELELFDFITKQKANIGFDYFYFIKVEDGNSPFGAKVKTVSGITSTLNMRRNASVLLDENDGGVVVRIADANDTITQRYMLFTMPFKNADGTACTYGDFEYDAIGIGFKDESLQQSLQADAFDGQGTCFIVLPDEEGNVLLQSGNGTRVEEFLAFLEKYGSFTSGKSVSDVRNYFKNVASQKDAGNDIGKIDAETLIVNIRDNGSYYLTYKPIGFSDWLLCGVVPSQVLNSNMSNFRAVTIAVMAVILACIVAGVIWVVYTNGKKRVEEKELEVRSREKLLDLLTQNSNDIFILFDANTFKCEYVSGNIDDILGIDKETVSDDVRMLKNSIDIVDFSVFGEVVDIIKNNGIFEKDVSVHNAKSGNEYWYKLVLREASKSKNSYVFMLSDRTREREMNENLESALDIAKVANEAKSNFLANMSHDIRTPMNAIIGFTTLLAKEAENPDKVREYVRKISFSSQHLLSLINDILDMSKIESGKSSLNIVEFDFPELLEEQYAMILPQTKAKNQNFEVRTKGYMPELVLGDKLRINQILLNLLSNAVKYTPNDGNILLQVESVDKSNRKFAHLRITVSDDGIGMSKEFQQIVFEPFARENSAAAREIQGTGLGMTITKQIVELMGGTISVESEIGKGSVFTVELELKIASSNNGDDADFWKKHEIFKVLVVDDEEEICLDVQELMRDTGVEVDYALNGAEAIDKIAKYYKTEKAYNIVLLDWKMPGMDGVETARRIRKNIGEDVPIMILTSYNFDEIEEEARAAGIDLFLSKPFFVSNFRHAVSQISETEERRENSEEERSPYSMEGLNILAAEDNEINAEILEELMDIEGAKCTIAVNGKEALEKFESSKQGEYDMIFMDVQMPVMNGYEATRAIRACSHPDAKTIPIIAMTANAFDDDVKSSIDSGMNAHLAKPIDMLKLKTIIAELRGGKNDQH